MKTKGQVGVGMLLTVGTLIAGAVATVFGIAIEAKSDVAAVSERAAKLETSVPLITENIKEIKAEQAEQRKLLNEILRRVQ